MLPRFVLRRSMLSVAVIALGAPALANPQGGSVAAGSATIVATPGRTEINQTSDRLIIDWRGFSIGPGEITRFNQPSASSAALNRVTGGDPSRILGQLSANGRLLLINPNGILFGAGSRIDVAGLIATTTNLRNEDFMARRLDFSMPSASPTASVVNQGSITVAEGGLVALVAPAVVNSGVIEARLGKVSLVAADRFTVDFHGDRLIRFALDDKVTRSVTAPDGSPLPAAVANSGRIAADGGVVQLSANVARGVLDRVIDMTGIIEARAVRQVGGAILLDGGETGTTQVSGRLDASGRGAGQSGGTVRILGQRVGLFAGASVDASGDAGGGQVLVGGNRLGQGAEQKAEAVYVDRDATISADAVTRGDGGQVVLWSESYTRFDGAISARGGAQGGNGGAVETSARAILQANGSVDAAAPAGRGGQWLLDPTDITITAGTTNGAFAGGVFTPTAGQATATADVATINAALSAGTNVSIDTNSTGAGSGDITVAQTINGGAGAATLSLTANRDIVLNSGVTSTGSLNVSANAGRDFTNNGGIVTGSGSVTVTAGGAYTSNNQVHTTNAAVSVNAASYNSTSGTLTTGNGALSITTTGGSVTLGDTNVGSGAITINATGGGITQIGAGTGIIQTGASQTITLNAHANPITLTNVGNAIAGKFSLQNTGANAIQLRTTGHMTLTQSSVGTGAVTLTAATGISQTGIGAAGAFVQASGAGVLTLTGGAGFIDFGNTANQLTGVVSVSNTGANDVAVRTLGSLTMGTSSTQTGSVSLTAGGPITQVGAFVQQVGAAGMTVNAGANPITLTNGANQFEGGLSLNNSGNNAVAVFNATPLTLAAGTIGGDLTLTMSSLTATGTVTTAGGTLTLNPRNASSDVRFGGAGAFTGLTFDNAQIANYSGFTSYVIGTTSGTGTVSVGSAQTLGNVSLTLRAGGSGGTIAMGNGVTLTGTAGLTLSAGGTVSTAAIATGSGGLTVTSGGGTTIGAAITTAGGAVSFSGPVSLASAGSISTASGSAAGAGITFGGALTGAGQSLTLNAGSAGDVSLQTVGTAGSPLGSVTITNARNVTASGLVAVSSLTQSAGSGTTSFGGSGLSASGAASLTTASVAGTYNVGSFTVTSSQTIATGSIAGVTGGAAAALASNSGSSGTQTFNGCVIGPVCSPVATTVPAATAAVATIGPAVAAGGLSAAQIGNATTAARQVVSSLGQPAPGEDPDRANVHGFEVAIPTTNVDWANPSGDLKIQLAPEYDPLRAFFQGTDGESRGAGRGARP